LADGRGGGGASSSTNDKSESHDHHRAARPSSDTQQRGAGGGGGGYHRQGAVHDMAYNHEQQGEDEDEMEPLDTDTLDVASEHADPVTYRAMKHGDPVTYEAIKCRINEEYDVACRREAADVFVPFSWVKKYFEVTLPSCPPPSRSSIS